MSKKYLGINSIDSIKEYVNKQIGAAITGEFVPPTNPDSPEVVQWTIGEDGYWYANGEKTNYKAIGEQGPQGIQGIQGENGVSTFKSSAFKRSNDDISSEQPIGGDWDNPCPNGWEDTIPEGNGMIWMTTRKFYSIDSMNDNEQWSLPKILQDSNSFDVAYGTSSVLKEDGSYDISGLPTKDDLADPKGSFDEPWYDEPENIPDGSEIWFMATAECNNGAWTKWVVSKIKGENGEKGESISIKKQYESLDEFKTDFGEALNIAPEFTSDCYLVKIDDQYNLFVWIDVMQEWENQGPFSGVAGEDGTSQFLHIKYASTLGDLDEFGNVVDYADILLTDKNGEDPNGAQWIGICKTDSTNNPGGDDPDPNDAEEGKLYKWTKIYVEPIITPTKFKSIVFTRQLIGVDISDVVPTGGTWDDPKPNNTDTIIWTDGIPAGNEGVIWSSYMEFISDVNYDDPESIIWSNPVRMIDTPSFETAYGAAVVASQDNLTIGLPTDDQGNANPSGQYDEPWYDEPIEGVDYEYLATATLTNGVWSTWKVFKIKGEKGDKGGSVKLSISFDSVDDMIEYYSDDKNGVDGEPIDAYKDNAHIIKNGPTDENDNILWHNHLFVWVGMDKDDNSITDGDYYYKGWYDSGQFNGTDGKDGKDGVNAYLHIKYAKTIVFNELHEIVSDGCVPTDNYGESSQDAAWIGICNSDNINDPTLDPEKDEYSLDNWKLYNWSEMVPESLVNERVKTTFGAYHISSNHIAGKTIDTAVDNNGNNNYVDLIAGTEYVTFTKDEDGNEVQNDPTEAVEGDKGPAWQLRTDGAGYLAKGNIRWDDKGDVTFGPDVKIAWDSENWDSKIPVVPTTDDIAGIAATTITDEFLATKNIYAKGIQGNVISGHTIQSSETTKGEPNWKIDNTGVGYFAKGNFEWDANGNVTLGGLNEDGTRPIITIADAWKTDKDGNIFAKNEMAKFANDGSGYIGRYGEGLSWDSNGNITINSQLKYNFQTIYIGGDERPEGLKISDVNKYLIKEGAASRMIDPNNNIKSIDIDWWNSDILAAAGLSNRLIDIDIINGTSNTIAINGTSNQYKNTIIYAPFRKSHDYIFPQNNFALGEISNQSSTTTNMIYLLPGTTLELQLYNLEGDTNTIGYIKNIGSFQLVSGINTSVSTSTNILCSMAPEHNNVPINNVDLDSIENDRQHTQFTFSHEFTAYKDPNVDDMMTLCKQNNLNIPLIKNNTYINAYYDNLNQKNTINLHSDSYNTCVNMFNETLDALNYDNVSKLNMSKFTHYNALTFNGGGMFDVTPAQLNFIKSYGLDIETIKNNDFEIPYLLKLNYYIPEYNKRFKSKPIRLFDLPDASSYHFEFDNNDINLLLSTLFNSSNKRLNIYDFIDCKHVINVEFENYNHIVSNRNSVNISKDGTAGKPIELIIDFNENQFNYGTNIVKPSADGTWFKISQPTEQDNKYIYELTITQNDSGEPREANIEMQCEYHDISGNPQTYTRNFKVTQTA